jgi:hypothetical protein
MFNILSNFGPFKSSLKLAGYTILSHSNIPTNLGSIGTSATFYYLKSSKNSIHRLMGLLDK